MKKILYTLMILVGVMGCANKSVTEPATPVIEAKPGIMAEEKTTVELKIPKEMKDLNSVDVVVKVYEYESMLLDKAANVVYTKTEHLTHKNGIPTTKKIEVQALRKEGFEYYVVIEIFEKTSRYTAKAYSIYDGLGKIYDAKIPNQVFTIDVK